MRRAWKDKVVVITGASSGPYVSAYAASKFAVRGFTASVRQEFEGTGIHVCTVLPAAIDTPLWQHSANYTGWRVRPIEPICSPERVARAIVRVLEHPRRELFIGPSRRGFALLPVASEKSMRAMTDSRHFEHQRQPYTSGNLFQSMARGTGRSGGYRSPVRPWFKRLLLAGGLVATATSLRRTAAGRRLGLRVMEVLGAQ